LSDVIPLKVVRTVGDTTALAEFTPTDTVPINQGGTGAITPTDARTNLGAASDADLTSHTSNTTNPHSVTSTQVGAIPTAEKGVANGVSTLDGGGKIPVSQIPATALPEVHVVADATARLALTVQEGDEAIQLDDGSHWIYDGASWHVRPSASAIFGSEFQLAESLGVSTTLFDENQTAFQNKLSMTTGALPLGDYRIGVSYGWNSDTTAYDFEGKFLVNNIQEGELHKQEAQDSAGSFSTTGTDQRHYTSRTFYLLQISGIQNFDLEYRSSYAGGDTPREASMWDARIEIWRVA